MQDKYPLPKYIYDYTEPELERFRKLCNFSEMELNVFNMKASGVKNYRIAIELCISDSTVSNYMRRIKKKMLAVTEKL